MLNKKILIKQFVVLLLVGSFLLQSEAFAWSHPRKRRRPILKKVSIPPFYLVAPILGGLTYLYCYNLATREKETTYVVVPSSTNTVVVPSATPTETSNAMITINIPNSNGSYTQVVLRKSGKGYIGPQGEYYPENPSVEQLKVLYGK